MYGLDMDDYPIYCHSNFYKFRPGEKHSTRICSTDVLVIMLEGTLYFHEDGKPVQVSKGEYYIQKQGLFQEGVIPSDDAYYYYIHFRGNYKNEKTTLPLSGNAYFRENFDGFERLNFLQNIKATKVEKMAEFYRILVKLKHAVGINHNREIVLQLVSLITEDMQKTYSLEQLAAHCNYSKNHLIRIFREETGQTPFDYITDLRINVAKNLLENSNMPIHAISDSCGFGNYINFYKSFTKRQNTTPELYRMQYLRGGH